MAAVQPLMIVCAIVTLQLSGRGTACVAAGSQARVSQCLLLLLLLLLALQHA